MSFAMFLVYGVTHGLIMDGAVLLGDGGTLLPVDGGTGLQAARDFN